MATVNPQRWSDQQKGTMKACTICKMFFRIVRHKMAFSPPLAISFLESASLQLEALDITANDSDRENYNKEFMELVDQLEKISNEEINGLPIFGAGGFSDDKKQFIESLHENWLKASEDLITQEYGWTPNANDSWELIVNENDSSSNYAAFVSTSWDGNGVADVIEMQFDLPDFMPHPILNRTQQPI